jgi:hypothetical protein
MDIQQETQQAMVFALDNDEAEDKGAKYNN